MKDQKYNRRKISLIARSRNFARILLFEAHDLKRSLLFVMIVFVILAPVVTGVRAKTIANLLSVESILAQNRTQAYLAKEVRHELVMLPYYSVFDWLQFETKPDGTVILKGEVTRPTLKSDAENVVKRVEGVEQVVNQIEVLPLSPNDDRIRQAIYRVLFNQNSPLLRYGMGAVPPIHIIVKNGNVSLKGVVSSKADADYAYIKARGVPGVFNVQNELVVEKD